MERAIPFGRWLSPPSWLTKRNQEGAGSHTAASADAAIDQPLIWDTNTPDATVFDATTPDYARAADFGSAATWTPVREIPTSQYTPVVRANAGGSPVETLAWVRLPPLVQVSGLGQEVKLQTQTVRLPVERFAKIKGASSQTANLLAGLRIDKGKLLCSKKMVLVKGTVLVPADAVVTLTVNVSAGTAPAQGEGIAPDVTGASVTLPATATFRFDPKSKSSEGALVQADIIQSIFAQQTFAGQVNPVGKPTYFELGETKALIFPFVPTASCASSVDFSGWQSGFVRFSGHDSLQSLGWALPVAQLAGPRFPELLGGGAITLATVATAANRISTLWDGMDRPVAWNQVLIALSRFSLQILCYGGATAGESPSAVHRVELYGHGKDPTAPQASPASTETSELELRVVQELPAGLSYVGILGEKEELAYVGDASFNIHQPVTATGLRLPLNGMRALVQVTRGASETNILVLPIPLPDSLSAFPPQSGGDPKKPRIAFENGLLKVVPVLAGIQGRLEGTQITRGELRMASQIEELLLTLPNPYVTSQPGWVPCVSNYLVVKHVWPDATPDCVSTTWKINTGDEKEDTDSSPELVGGLRSDAPVLLDVSGQGDQFGVAARMLNRASPTVVPEALEAQGTRLALRGNRLTLVTLPPFSWEPMIGLPIGGSQKVAMDPDGFRPATVVFWKTAGKGYTPAFTWPLPDRAWIFPPFDPEKNEYPGPTLKKYRWVCSWRDYFNLDIKAPDDTAYLWEYEYRVIASDADTGDGPFAAAHIPTQELIAIDPLSLASVVGHNPEHPRIPRDFKAQLGLPFGLVAHVDSTSQSVPASEVIQNVRLQSPVFPDGKHTRIQLQFEATKYVPPLGRPSPKPARFGGCLDFAGYRNPKGDEFIAQVGPGYAQRTVGVTVTEIARNEFGAQCTGLESMGLPAVPLERYDLSGYGASLFSNWRDFNHEMVDGGPTCVAQMQFAAMMGRVAQEKVVVDSIVYPWGIKVRRTVTMDRKQAGWVLRQDSGWIAISDATFWPFEGEDLHQGLVKKIVQIEHIREIKDAVFDDEPTLTKQAVRFDGRASIDGVSGESVALRDAWGYIPLDILPPDLGKTDPFVKNNETEASGKRKDAASQILDVFGDAANHHAVGRVDCAVNLLNSGFVLRATQIEATPFSDQPASDGKPTLCISVGGSPMLPSQGAWSVTYRASEQDERRALPKDAPVPVIRRNGNDTVYFSAPDDLFRAEESSKESLKRPRKEYAFMQDTGTQRLLQAHPRLSPGTGSQKTANKDSSAETPLQCLDKNLPFGDIRSLLGATGLFPDDAQSVAWELDNALGEFTQDGGLHIEKTKLLPASVPCNTIIVSASGVSVELWYQGITDGLTKTDSSLLDVSLDAGSWSIHFYNFALVVMAGDTALFGIGFNGNAAGLVAANDQSPTLTGGALYYSAYLQPIVDILDGLVTLLSAAGGTKQAAMPRAESSPSASGLQVGFANGALNASLSVGLGEFPLGLGALRDLSFGLGGSLRLLPSPEVNFGISLGTLQHPVTWIATPLAGSFYARFGVSTAHGKEITIQGGLGLGIALSVAVASGHASLIISVRVDISDQLKLTALLSGNAGVDVLGGVASASLDLEASASITKGSDETTLSADVAVGIHISIAWVIDVDFEGSWPFETTIA